MLLSARMVSNMGLAGIAFAGSDMGGFIGNPSANLFSRWISQGVFTPFFRGHTEINSNYKEPWAFGEETEDHARNMLNLRYRLLPYIYSSFFISTQTGMPVARSLAINYTFDENIYNPDYQNEYLFGPAFLVIPVSSYSSIAKIYLPDGKWYDFTTEKLYEGKKEILFECPIKKLPVFIKESAIIPMQSVVQNTAEMPSDTLLLNIYKGKNLNCFTYYEDDGISYNYEKGDYLKRDIIYDPVSEKLSFSKAEGNYLSKFKSVKIRFIGFDLKSVKINNRELSTDKNNAIVVPFEEKVISEIN
jgi:alpha-glucosidase